MFDCMVYGLSFNIREIGTYIREHVEREMPLPKERWETCRDAKARKGYKDWGRIVFRIGNYGLSLSVTMISFLEGTPPIGTPALSVAWSWRVVLILVLSFAWGILIWIETSKRARVMT
jgi:hypothetical protein